MLYYDLINNKDGVSCIIEYYYNRCFFLQSIWAKQQRISSFSSSKKQKRKNKDGVSCIIEYYYDRCLVYEQNNKELVVFRIVKNKKEKTKMA